MPTPGQASGRQGPGLFLAGAAGLFLLALLAGLYLFFPNEALKQRLIQEASRQTGAETRIDSLSLYPLLSLSARRISIGNDDLPWPVVIDRLQASPHWTTLFSGDPGVRTEARLLQGVVTTSWRQSGRFSARAEGLRFELPLTAPLTLRIAGTLDTAEIASGTRLDSDTETRLTLRLTGVTVVGLDLTGAGPVDLDFGTITLTVEGQGRTLRLSALRAAGGLFDIDGGGSLLVGRTADASRLQLSLRIRPAEQLDPNLAALLELAGRPDADGRYTLQINGSLTKPSINFGG
ncbi:MAG: type II secretion system protein GspN [Desulfuromonadales bacterium]|nr:type II secretion system protein GspN [Desulfuromonadales bacterium]